MNCEQMTVLISAWLDGEITEQEEKQLSAHLEQCAACRALLEQLQTLRASFSDLEELTPAPDGFADRVMDKIRAESKPKVVPLFRRPQIRALAGLAACALLCVGLMNGTGRKSAEAATGEAAAAAPAALAPEEYGMANGAPAEMELDYSAKAVESPVEKTAEERVMTTEPAMASAAPMEPAAPESTEVTFDGVSAEDVARMIPILTVPALPEGMEELGELSWETREEDGAPFAILTREQGERLMELLEEQDIVGCVTMFANAEEELWMLVVDSN